VADDPALPPNLARDLAEIRRRLKNVESANRLQSSSVRGGAMLVLDDDGNSIVYMGRLIGTNDGLQVDGDGGATGMMHVSSQIGWAQPYLMTSTFVRPTEAETVTSGSFVDAWLAKAEQNLSEHVRFTCAVATDAATTAEVRFTVAGTPIGDTLVLAGSHSAYHEFAAPTGGVLFAGPYWMALQARRTGGAGNVYVYRPFGLVMGKFDDVIAVTGWIS
jgi:hypothetical protein